MTRPAGEEERELAARRELYAVLAHEFRSPIGAILGYEELLSDGVFGEVTEPGREALARIRSSARQLLDLVAGLNDLAGRGGPADTPDLETNDLATLLQGVADLRPDALGRGNQLDLVVPAGLARIHTDGERVQRALRLAVMAALKSTAGARITVRAGAAQGALHLQVEGSQLTPARDDPAHSLHRKRPRLTAAGLRIAMARDALAPLRGTIELESEGDVILRITIPAPDPPAAADHGRVEGAGDTAGDDVA